MGSRLQKYIETWERRCYKKGIPDESPIEIVEKVPSYKRIAIAILNNDHSLKSLGFTPKHSYYYDVLKKIELSERGKIIQLRLFP